MDAKEWIAELNRLFQESELARTFYNSDDDDLGPWKDTYCKSLEALKAHLNVMPVAEVTAIQSDTNRALGNMAEKLAEAMLGEKHWTELLSVGLERCVGISPDGGHRCNQSPGHKGLHSCNCGDAWGGF